MGNFKFGRRKEGAWVIGLKGIEQRWFKCKYPNYQKKGGDTDKKIIGRQKLSFSETSL
jgi:hypothetical protein